VCVCEGYQACHGRLRELTSQDGSGSHESNHFVRFVDGMDEEKRKMS
jgi:hypothetical protein